MNRILSISISVGCFMMVAIGLFAFFNMNLEFKAYPSERARMVYDKFYFIPYIFMFCFGILYALGSITARLKIWLSSIGLGGSIFCLFFVDVGAIYHDFGHVIYGGCIESLNMKNLIINFNIVCVVVFLYLTLVSFVEFRRYLLIKNKIKDNNQL